jgi:hypothetical protein
MARPCYCRSHVRTWLGRVLSVVASPLVRQAGYMTSQSRAAASLKGSRRIHQGELVPSKTEQATAMTLTRDTRNVNALAVTGTRLGEP